MFFIFAQNIGCGYTLELLHRDGSNEYPQSMFWIKNKNNRYTPVNPRFVTYNSLIGYEGVYFLWTHFLDAVQSFLYDTSLLCSFYYNTAMSWLQK